MTLFGANVHLEDVVGGIAAGHLLRPVLRRSWEVVWGGIVAITLKVGIHFFYSVTEGELKAEFAKLRHRK